MGRRVLGKRVGVPVGGSQRRQGLDPTGAFPAAERTSLVF